MDDVVGQRVAVFWDEVGDWFNGVVKEVDDRKVFVVYDDGDEQWENLDHRQMRRLRQHDISETSELVNSNIEMLQPPESSPSSSEDIEEDEAQRIGMPIDASSYIPNDCAVDTDRQATFEKPSEVLCPTTYTGDVQNDCGEDVSSGDSSDVPDFYEMGCIKAALIIPKPTSVVLRMCTKARLQGSVLSASHLPLHNGRTDMNALVKVAFVEASDSENLMLRSKRILHTTTVIFASSNPVWEFECNALDPAFAMDVIPPMLSIPGRSSRTSPIVRPQWEALRGDLLFSVYHIEVSDSTNYLVAQALLPLQEVIGSTVADDLLHRQLPLKSPQGFQLADCILTVSVWFVLKNLLEASSACGGKSKKLTKQPCNTPSIKSIQKLSKTIQQRDPTPCSRTDRTIKHKQQTVRRKHVSSAEVNRRRNDIMIRKQNEAMQRRLFDAKHRRRPRTRSSPPPLAIAPSFVNRKKLQAQIAIENQQFTKRIADQRMILTSSARGDVASTASGEACNHDLRPQKRELDLQLQYRQQSELVVQMNGLSAAIADLKIYNSTLSKELRCLKISIDRVQRLKNALVKTQIGVIDPPSAAVQVVFPTSASGIGSRHSDVLTADTTANQSKQPLMLQLEKLEKEVDYLSAVKKHLATSFEECNRQCVLGMEALEVQQAEWNSLQHREKPQHEEVGRLREQIRVLRVEIQVLQQRDLTQRQMASDRSQQLTKLQQKLQHKRSKVELLQAQRERWQSQTEELCEQNALRTRQARQQIQDMQQILFLLEKEKHQQ